MERAGACQQCIAVYGVLICDSTGVSRVRALVQIFSEPSRVGVSAQREQGWAFHVHLTRYLGYIMYYCVRRVSIFWFFFLYWESPLPSSPVGKGVWISGRLHYFKLHWCRWWMQFYLLLKGLNILMVSSIDLILSSMYYKNCPFISVTEPSPEAFNFWWHVMPFLGLKASLIYQNILDWCGANKPATYISLCRFSK